MTAHENHVFWNINSTQNMEVPPEMPEAIMFSTVGASLVSRSDRERRVWLTPVNYIHSIWDFFVQLPEVCWWMGSNCFYVGREITLDLTVNLWRKDKFHSVELWLPRRHLRLFYLFLHHVLRSLHMQIKCLYMFMCFPADTVNLPVPVHLQITVGGVVHAYT